jgi:uncharacterized spore protein YtfJ
MAMSKVDELINGVRDTLTVGRVYGEPLEKNGVVVLPAALVRGGAGGGEGEPGENQPGGLGGGFGMSAKPIGAYQIRGDRVTWVPAPNVTTIVVSSQVFAIVALLVIRSIIKQRRKRAG